MIDVWADLFDEVARKVLDAFPEAYVTSTYELVPPDFPCVAITVLSDVEVRSMVDSSGDENGSELTLQCDVYTAGDDMRTDGMALMQVVDGALRLRNFRRSYMAPVTNATDPTVSRLTGRYVAIVDKHHRFFGGR